MKAGNQTAGVRLRIVLGPDVALGPGKAALLEGVQRTGSIAGAGRALDMSYKRAWLLVETMNRCFREPLVVSTRGGRDGGGARLTAIGQQVLGGYRRAEALAEQALADELAALRELVDDGEAART